MTTRSVDLPMSRKVGAQAEGGLGADKADKTNKAVKAKWVGDCNPEYMFEDKSLKTWMRSLDKGPQPMAEAIEGQPGTPIRKTSRAEHILWRSCVMINSIHSIRGSKAFEASKGSKQGHPDKVCQSL